MPVTPKTLLLGDRGAWQTFLAVQLKDLALLPIRRARLQNRCALTSLMTEKSIRPEE